MQTAQALERIAYEFVRDVAAEHVWYVEVRYSPALHRPALTLTEAIEAPLAGIKRAEAETGTKVGLIICGIRTLPPAEDDEPDLGPCLRLRPLDPGERRRRQGPRSGSA